MSETQETDIDPAVSNALQNALHLPEQPQTLREWGEAMGELVSRSDIDGGLETLCTTEQSPHRAAFDGQVEHFVCVQDAFIVPFLANDVDTVDITTESPLRGERIEVTLTDETAEITPAGAVMSFGVSDDVTDPPADLDSPELAYGKVCPYGHAFPDQAAYEEWAETVDAVTMSAPLANALELGRAIGNSIQ